MLDGYTHHEVDESLVEACFQRPRVQGPRGRIRIQDVVGCLLAAGMRVFVSGRAPRDWLSGGTVKDIDFVVDQPIQHVHSALAAAFPGVDAILIHSVDISILRSAESIHGKPISQTRFEPSGSLYADGRMCDFSINALYLYYDRLRRQLLEPLEGSLEDLRQQRLRLISHPRKLAVDYRTSMRIAQFVSRGFEQHVPAEPRVRETFHACLLPHLKDPLSRELLARAVEIGAQGEVSWSPPGPGGQTRTDRRVS